jgi:hypothetical protein
VILGHLQQHGDQVTMSLPGEEGRQIFSGRLGHRGERGKGDQAEGEPALRSQNDPRQFET